MEQLIETGAVAGFPDSGDPVDRLVAEAKSGDMEAFGALVLKYQRRVFRVAYSITQNREDAEDVTQAVFLKVLVYLKNFRGSAKFSTWLTRIAVNESLLELRRRRTHVQATSIDSLDESLETPAAFEIPDPRLNPEERCRQSQASDYLSAALEELRPALRIVFVLRDMEGLSCEETASALGLTAQAVKTRLMRARLALRELLQKHVSMPTLMVSKLSELSAII
jgi:RNA polymerase sigma-70 factor, ECF subfamily